MAAQNLQKRLEELQKRKAQIEAAIQQTTSKKRVEEHRHDTRRKILLGSLLIKALDDGKDIGPDNIVVALDEFLGRDYDRKLFGLEPIHPVEKPD